MAGLREHCLTALYLYLFTHFDIIKVKHFMYNGNLYFFVKFLDAARLFDFGVCRVPFFPYVVSGMTRVPSPRVLYACTTHMACRTGPPNGEGHVWLAVDGRSSKHTVD